MFLSSRSLQRALVFRKKLCLSKPWKPHNLKWYCSSSTKKKQELTPLERQWQQMKLEAGQDFVLLFQVGDFYEMYNEDAVFVAQNSNLKLGIKKQKLFTNMSGFPIHSLPSWVKTLLGERGLKNKNLAIVNQIAEDSNETTAEVKKIMERKIVRRITPGTLCEYLSADHDTSSGHLMALPPNIDPIGNLVSAVFINMSSLSMFVHEGTLEELEELIVQVQPAEILSTKETFNYLTKLPYSIFPKHRFTIRSACEFSLDNKAGYGLLDDVSFDGLNDEQMALQNAIFHYLNYTFPTRPPRISSLSSFKPSSFLQMDGATLSALELLKNSQENTVKGSLYDVMNKCVTLSGRRLLKEHIKLPLIDRETIDYRLDCVESLFGQTIQQDKIRVLLKKCVDINKTVLKADIRKLKVLDIWNLIVTTEYAREIHDILVDLNTDRFQTERNKLNHSFLFEKFEGFFEQVEGKEGKVVLRQCDSRRENRREIDVIESEAKRICSELNHIEEIFTLKDHAKLGYVLEVKQSAFHNVELRNRNNEFPFNLKSSTSTKSVYRYTCDELMRCHYERLQRENNDDDEEKRALESLMLLLDPYLKVFREMGESLAQIDVYISLARAAEEQGMTRPTITENAVLDVKGGFHPVVKKTSENYFFVENDCLMTEDRQLVITGPNMGGKSTFMRQNAIIIILAQMGSFIPAHSATLMIFNSLFTRVGASDDLSRHMSTFMMEMSETSRILKYATSSSFVILDEIGRGTSPQDGMAIAIAVMEHLHTVGCKVISATHFHGLNQYLKPLDNLKYFRTSYIESEIGFTYRIEPGVSPKSYGIEVASLAGLPSSVCDRAKELIGRFQGNSEEQKPDITHSSTYTPLHQEEVVNEEKCRK